MLILQLDDVNIEYVYFGNSVKNTILSNSCFRHINYSTHYFSLNTIYIKIPLVGYIKYSKFFFKREENEKIIHKIQEIENSILDMSDKIKQYNITHFLNGESISNIENSYILLKISGIWETPTHCGLTFKFIHLPKT